MEGYLGMFFELEVQDLRGHGFTVEAVILEECGDSFVLRQVVSTDALLQSREAAEDLAGQVAREWIEENGMRNRDRGGREFRSQMVDIVWRKGAIVREINRTTCRRDMCGAIIDRDQYGKETPTGWEIDHIVPKARGGGDDLANLQPLQWENNRDKGNDHPNWNCLRRG